MLALAAALLLQSGSDVLLRFAAVEAAAKSLSATGIKQRISAATTSVTSLPFSIQLAKPNKARVDMSDRLIVADGTTITSYDKESKTFIREPQSEAGLKGLFSNGEMAIFGSFFDPTFYDKVRGKLGKRVRKGTNFDVIEADVDLEGPKAAAFYLDPADKLLKIGEFTYEGDNGKETLVVSAKDLSLDSSQGGDTYTFTPPAGAHEITLEELRKANVFEAPPTFFDKALQTWHLYQCDERGNFPNGGKDFCAPTAAANALTYLGLHGYPKLFQGDDMAGLSLISALASPDYMGTDPASGTGPQQIIKGLLRFIGEHGYAIQSIGWEGWRSLGYSMRSYKLADSLDMNWVRQGIAMPNAVVLFNLGWYAKEGSNYHRFSGHWITVVGYGSMGGSSDPDPDLFLVHDPAKRTAEPEDGKAWLPNDVLKLTPAPGVTLTGNFTGLPRSASGLFTVAGKGLNPNQRADLLVLDGAIVVSLKPAK